LLMADLGVTKTHSRPHVSDDNPYSEKVSSAPSNTALASRTASAPSKTLVAFANPSSAGTTLNITTPAWA
jgi:hypothetical protein